MVIRGPDLLRRGLRDRYRRVAGLIDRDDLVVGEQSKIERVELRQVGAPDVRMAPIWARLRSARTPARWNW